MAPDTRQAAVRRRATDQWEHQFLANAEFLERVGLSRKRAHDFVQRFVRLAREIPAPEALRAFDDPSALTASSLLTEGDPETSAFMLEFLEPLMKCVTIEGELNLNCLAPLVGRCPITLVANHQSHIDAPAISWALRLASRTGRDLAERLVFLVGRFASQAPFARPALSLFGSLLVCSPRDINETPVDNELMGRINRCAFRQARRLQSQGRVLALFPEGTRSLDGRPGPFLASVYPYLVGTVVLPVRLENTQALLPNSGLVFKKAVASLTFGEPVFVGDRPTRPLPLPAAALRRIEGTRGDRGRQAVLDEVAALCTGHAPGRASAHQ